MAKLVSFSEAATIGLHGMVMIARAGEQVNVLQIADTTGSSKHHIAKVMQRLVKEGLLLSNRGPTGGFFLKSLPAKISLLQIYEAIEGKIKIDQCFHEKEICPFGGCILGDTVPKMTTEFANYLASHTLADLL